MYEIKIPDSLVTSFFTYLGTLSWPIIVLAIVYIFRQPITKLLANLKTAKWKDMVLEFGDKIPVYSSKEKRMSVGVVEPIYMPPFTAKIDMGKIQRLPEKEIIKSLQRALKRIEEDTKQVGYKRGEPYQLENGKWAVTWDLKVSDGIILKG